MTNVISTRENLAVREDKEVPSEDVSDDSISNTTVLKPDSAYEAAKHVMGNTLQNHT